jgi:hypothetical protein
MGHLTDDDYEAEKVKVTRYHDILEYPVLIFLFIGIIMAAFNVTLGGFTPTIWFILSLWFVLVIICMEITMIRTTLERRK